MRKACEFVSRVLLGTVWAVLVGTMFVGLFIVGYNLWLHLIGCVL